MNRLLALGILLLLAGQVLAQQKPQYTQYPLNNYLLNTAISGIEDYADVKLGSRQQWSGLEGAPQSFYATFHTPLNKSHMGSNMYRRARPHHGMGAMVMTTRTGPLKRTSLSASYAYHQPLAQNLKVAAGVAPGLIQYSLDQGYVKTGTDADPAVLDGRINEIKFDLNMGLWLYSDRFYVGVAGAQLVPSKRQYISPGSVEDNKGQLQKHFFVTGGARLEVAHELDVIPSVMVKLAQPSTPSVDATVRVLYANRLWAGISYRHQESVAAMAGINISPLLDLAYSYDASASPLAKVHAGSHEVVLGFKLRNTRKILCPEWAW